MKIVLVDPNQPSDNKLLVRRSYEYEPLGLEYIAAYLVSSGYEVIILRQLEKDTRSIAAEILACDPDIVGFTVLTYNYEESKRIAKAIKNAKSDIITVFGGYHPSAVPEIVLNPEIDFCIVGEGEETFKELVETISNNTDPDIIKGIAFEKGGSVYSTPQRNRITDLSNFPKPLRTESILTDSRILGLMYPPPSKQKNVVMISCSRGCPNNCDYCCSDTVWGRELVYRAPSDVIDEIMHCQEEFGTNTFFFCDLTFNSNKPWLLELCARIIKSGLTINWFCLCTINGLDEEMIDIMSRSGCRKIAFGIEAFDSPNFESMKSFNIPSLSEINYTLGLCNHNNILTKSYFLIGRPDEDLNYLNEFEINLMKLDADEITIFYYTIFPGTKAFEKYRECLTCNDLSKYDLVSQLVLKNENVPDELYVKTRYSLLHKFYSRKQYTIRMQDKVIKYPELKESYLEFWSFLEQDGIT